MITESSMYWITRCDSINAASVAMTILSAASLVMCIVGYFVHAAENDQEACKKFMYGVKFSTAAFIAFLLVDVLVPTTREMCAIKVVPLIVNNEAVGETLSGAKELAVEWMKAEKDKLERDAQEVKK